MNFNILINVFIIIKSLLFDYICQRECLFYFCKELSGLNDVLKEVKESFTTFLQIIFKEILNSFYFL